MSIIINGFGFRRKAGSVVLSRVDLKTPLIVAVEAPSTLIDGTAAGEHGIVGVATLDIIDGVAGTVVLAGTVRSPEEP